MQDMLEMSVDYLTALVFVLPDTTTIVSWPIAIVLSFSRLETLYYITRLNKLRYV